MRKFFFFLSLLIVVKAAVGQSESGLYKKSQLAIKELMPNEIKTKFSDVDFSSLFTVCDNAFVYGFIGEGYQRIRIKIITVKKDSASTDTYLVYGKSMVKNNIDEFQGTINITNIRKIINTSQGVDNHLKGKGIKGEFMIVGDYDFLEDRKQAHPGRFQGTFRSDFYLDKNNQFHYDDIDNYADGYCSNQFVGKWIDYKFNLAKRCNWGDYRIPNSGGFDIGAGEFSPSKGGRLAKRT